MINVHRLIARLAIGLKSKESLEYSSMAQRLFQGERTDLLEYQRKQFDELLLYAYKHVPYYHKIFDEIGLIEEDKVCRDKIKNIPILTKEIIRTEGEKLWSDEYMSRKFYKNTSGGSTGEPVTFLQDKQYFNKNFGDKILFGLLNNKYPGDKELKIWGSERDILDGTIGLKEKLVNFAYNRELINSFILDEEKIKFCIERINKSKPKQIWTYADSIYSIAQYVNDNKLNVYSKLNIITTAGVLFDEMREEIKKAFPESRILNQYGSREAGAIGIETEPGEGFRIFEHSVLVEVETEEGSIKEEGFGKLLVTNLTNYSMPLIRYSIGDMGTVRLWEEGDKGSFSTIEKLSGRINMHFKTRTGKIIHGEYFTHLFYEKEWIENFKVIQHDYEDIEFRIVVKSGFERKEEDIKDMVEKAKVVMPECNVTITYHNELDKLASGKYQFVVSEVN